MQNDQKTEQPRRSAGAELAPLRFPIAQVQPLSPSTTRPSAEAQRTSRTFSKPQASLPPPQPSRKNPRSPNPPDCLVMDNPWRFPAGAGADLCPVCSAPHFPFCPPPPLPPHPFPYDLYPPPPPPPPQYHALFHPPPPPMWGPLGPHPYELPDREGPHKRMRVGEAPPFDPYAAALPPPPPMPGRASVEGERLIGLIRDHGRPPPLSSPPTQWHGEPYPPDSFGFGGGRGYPSPNYNNPYAQGGNFANHDHAGRMPPPPPPHDRHSAFSSDFVPAGGPQEKYFDGDHRYHQFHPEVSPGAPPLPPLPRYAEAGNHYDCRDWHPEAGVVRAPPESPVPSPPDYHVMPPPRAANSSLFPVFSGSLATTALPPSAYTLHQAHPMPNANCYNGPNHNEVHFPHSVNLDALLMI